MSSVNVAALQMGVIGTPSNWASLDANNLSGILVPAFDRVLADQIENHTLMFRKFIKQKTKNWKPGTAYGFNVKLRRNTGAAVTVDNGNIPAGALPGTRRGYVYSKWGVNSLSVTDGLVASLGDPEAFVDELVFLVEELEEGVEESLARWVYLDGTGVLATLSDTGSPTGTDVTLDVNMYLMMDQEVEIWNAARTTKRGNAFVTNLAFDAPDASFSVVSGGVAALPTGTIATDVVCIRGSQDGTAGRLNFIGLEGMVDDGTEVSNYEQISETSNPEWASYILALTAGDTDWDTDKMHRLYQGVPSRGGAEFDLLIVNPYFARTYSEFFQPAVTYHNGNAHAATAGFSSLDFKSGQRKKAEIEEDRLCPPGTMYAISTKEVMWLQRKAFGWRPTSLGRTMDSGGGAFAASQTQLNYNGAYTWCGELATKRRNAHGKITGLNITPESYAVL